MEVDTAPAASGHQNIQVGKSGAGPTYQTTMVGSSEFTIDSRYTQLKPIGSGAYGLVVSALDSRTGNRVAIKKMGGESLRHLGDFRRILREVKLLLHFRNNPDCLHLLDIMTTPADSPSFHTCYLVTELYASDLSKIIRSGQALSDAHVQYLLYQALRGIRYIHSASVLHRDLKPANLLCNGDCKIAVCDFNLGRGVDAASSAKLSSVAVGTPQYRAPELLWASELYGPPVDVWALGCIFGELLRGKPVFACEKADDLRMLEAIVKVLGTPSQDDIQRLTRDSTRTQLAREKLASRGLQGIPPTPWHVMLPSAPPLALDLLSRMLVFDQHRRITISEALAHPYLALTREKCLRNFGPEALCPQLFNFDWERGYDGRDMPEELMRQLIVAEMCALRPTAGAAAAAGPAAAGATL